MAIFLSAQERELVSKYVKAERPTWYNDALGAEQQIGEDLEKFIILQPPKSRNAVVAWLQDSRRKTGDRQDRETLLSEALTSELQDGNNQLTEADAGLVNYDKFIEQYFENIIPEGSGSVGSQLLPKRVRFGDVAEVGQVVTDLNAPVDEFLAVRSRAKHQMVLAQVLMNQLSRGSRTAGQERQMTSWATAFSAYQNGTR